MTRTNIEIDDVLVDRAMRLYRLRSKREAVDLALRKLVGEPMSREEALATEGTGWDGDLDRDSFRRRESRAVILVDSSAWSGVSARYRQRGPPVPARPRCRREPTWRAPT